MDDKELACLQAIGRTVEGMTERERLEFVGRVAMYVANVAMGQALGTKNFCRRCGVTLPCQTGCSVAATGCHERAY